MLPSKTRVPHWLYGHIAGREAYSVGRYLDDVTDALARARAEAKRPIIVGGTGLYFKALLEGLSPVPPIPVAIRDRCREIAGQAEPGALHQVLAARDPVMAGRLDARDVQRLTRALEVIEATGQSLAIWQQRAGEPVLRRADVVALAVRMPRAVVQSRCDARLDAMMATGAIDEVRALQALQLAPDLPVMRALGVSPLLRYLDGVLSREAAVAAAKLETRRYVKRQETWLRRFMADWVDPRDAEAALTA